MAGFGHLSRALGFSGAFFAKVSPPPAAGLVHSAGRALVIASLVIPARGLLPGRAQDRNRKGVSGSREREPEIGGWNGRNWSESRPRERGRERHVSGPARPGGPAALGLAHVLKLTSTSNDSRSRRIRTSTCDRGRGPECVVSCFAHGQRRCLATSAASDWFAVEEMERCG